MVGDDITISCSLLWMLRLIFDRESVNHNADNTGVLVRRRVLKIADKHTITTSRGRDGKMILTILASAQLHIMKRVTACGNSPGARRLKVMIFSDGEKRRKQRSKDGI